MIEDTDVHLVLLGSANQPRTIKNPYTFEERREELLRVFPNVKVLPLNDYLYNDELWQTNVRSILDNFEDVSIYGHTKPGNDYLNWFDDYNYVEVDSGIDINATSIRTANYKEGTMPANAQADYEFYEHEKKLFAGYPFPETLQFNCADALLIRYPDLDTNANYDVLKAEVLLIQRKFAPGAGTWALPGGFKNNDETFFECAKRELFEEAGVNIERYCDWTEEHKHECDFFVTSQLFDSPKRAVGTIPRITLCVVFQSTHGTYDPVIKADDDAAAAKWFTVHEILNELDLFHDHRDIISTMLDAYASPAHLTCTQY
jgi:bifunctional NMN adenylyltransferase/nudix hydrolase